MFCTHCGETNADTARYCRRCGQPFAATTNRLAEPPLNLPPPGTSAPTQPIDPAAPETDSKAVASLVCGLVFFLFPLTTIAAIVLGIQARADIKRSGGRKKGEGMALAGMILGFTQVAMIPVFLIIAAIAIPNLLRAKQSANEASAVSRMHAIVAAEVAVQSQKQTFTCDGHDFPEGAARHAVTGGTVSGYAFDLQGCTDSAFQAIATPVNDSTGRRTFCADETGVVKASPGRTDANTCLRDGKPISPAPAT
jgi:type II secretory pathway pseudopilin PulG